MGEGTYCLFPSPVVGVSSEFGQTICRLEEVEFRLQANEGDVVRLCGSWNPCSTVPMRDVRGLFFVVLRIPAGMYEFHFHVNGEHRVSFDYEVNGRSGLEENNIRVVAMGMSPESAEHARREREFRLRQRLFVVTQLTGSRAYEGSDDESSSEYDTSESFLSDEISNSKRKGPVRRPFSIGSSRTSTTTIQTGKGGKQKKRKHDMSNLRKSLMFTFVDEGDFQPLSPPKFQVEYHDDTGHLKRPPKRSIFDGLREKITPSLGGGGGGGSVDLTTCPFVYTKTDREPVKKGQMQVHPSTVVKLSSLVAMKPLRASVELVGEQAARLRGDPCEKQKSRVKRWFRGAFTRIKSTLKSPSNSHKQVA